ncbi:hypothetical protein SAMN05216311_105365 [Chitinophaga sp. CF418]|nr:hypothetical protein SAMN05216311_105365 [Chitinophaga sp. CF418]
MLSLITSAVITFFCTGSTTVLAQKKVLNPGTFNIEKNGAVISSKDIRGTATIGSSKMAIMNLECTLRDGNRTLSIKFDLKKIGEFKPVTISLDQSAGGEESANFAQFLNYPKDESAENADDAASKDVSCNSEKGTFTLTEIRFDDVKAFISGHFEFTGRNDIESGAEKTINLKGTFSGVQIVCMGPHP